MKVRARIAGIIEARPVVAEGEVELKEGATLKGFFRHADKALGFARPKYFQRALKQGMSPTILLNGDRLDLPQGFKRRLAPGDEVTVLLPMSGG